MSTVVNEVTPFAQYEASAGADTFQYTWWIREETDLKVYVDGELVATTDYTVSGTQTSTGGNVVFDTPLTGGEIVTISTDYPFERLTGFATSGSLRAAALNLELSYLVACILQLQRDIQRTLKLSPSSQVDTTALVLPEPEDQRILYWNGTEGVISNSAFNIDVLEGNAADIAANLTAINALYTQLAAIVNVSANLGTGLPVTVVAANTTSLTTVATNIANVNLVGGSIASVNTVAGSIANVNAVAGNATNINAVAGNATNINAVAGNATNINAVAADATDIGTVATDIANVNTVAGSIANVNTVAAADSDISTVVTNLADIQAAPQAAIDAAAAQAAAEAARDATLASFDSFDDRYLGAKASDPTLDNDGNALTAGALYFNTGDGAMKVYTGSVWVAAYVSGGDFFAIANNLSEGNAGSMRTNLGLGALATQGDGDKGDVTVSASGATWTVNNNAVTSTKIANSNVTLAKLENLANQRLIGRNSSGTGVPESININNVLGWISNTQGATLYRGASVWSALAPGTAGQVLTMNSGATAPEWADPAGGGAPYTNFVLLTSGTSWNVPAGVSQIMFGMVAGGGASGAVDSPGGLSQGGTNGEEFTGFMEVTPGGTLSYSIGAGGTAGSGIDGGNGGDTVLGSLTARGGIGGLKGAGNASQVPQSPLSASGVVPTSGLTIISSRGRMTERGAPPNNVGASNPTGGGSSSMGVGGAELSGVGDGNAATGYGSGGGGAFGGGAKNGVNGQPGAIWIRY